MPKTKKKSASRVRETKKQVVKDKILQAALTLFQKKGFAQTTTKELAAQAGVAEGTIYNYFATKEDLALYFYEKEIEQVMSQYQKDKTLQKAPLNEKLFGLIHMQLEQLSPYEDFIHAAFIKALDPRSKLNPLKLDTQVHTSRYLQFIKELFVKAHENGEIPPLGDWGAYMFATYYYGILYYWLKDTSEDKQKTMAMLDRSLTMGFAFLNKSPWTW
jgi:AcrR family transcriptional regulator